MAVDLTPEQMARAFAELAAATDTTPVSCQCIIGCGEHARGQCPNPAEITLEVHCLGTCTGEEANVYGNRVEMMCRQCAARMLTGTAQMVARMVFFARRAGKIPSCTSCGAPIWTVNDVIRNRKSTPGGIR